MISGYGQDNLILRRSKLPNFIPIIPYYEHGWSIADNLIPSYKNSHGTFHLSWNNRMKKKFEKEKIKKKVFIMGSPFIFYKEKYDIKKKRNKNTIFFLAHSTPLINSDTTIEQIDKNLRNLPDFFKPIDICCHIYDYKKFKNMEKLGYKVFSPGNVFDNNYPKKFYEIISNYTLSISNQLGSYTLYSVNLDIPFFLIGQSPTFNNFGGDKNVAKNYSVSNYKFAKEISPMFNKFYEKVTLDQKNLVENELGINSRISSKELRRVLIDSLKSSMSSRQDFISLLKSFIKPINFHIKKHL